MDVAVDDVEGGAALRVKVHPRARRDGITGAHDGALKVSITAAPERGKANEALCRLLAGVFGVPPSRVSVLTGATAALKRVGVQGLTADAVRERLRAVGKG